MIIALGFLVASGYAAIERTTDGYRVAVGLVYLALLAGIAVHDAETRRAPNLVVYPALIASALFSVMLGPGIAAEALAGGAATFAVLLVIALIGRGAMGLGDVKVGALCGIVVGLHGVLPLLGLTFAIGLAVCLPLVLLGVYRLSDTLAFTPFLAAATAVTLCLGHSYLWR